MNNERNTKAIITLEQFVEYLHRDCITSVNFITNNLNIEMNEQDKSTLSDELFDFIMEYGGEFKATEISMTLLEKILVNN